MADVNTKLSLFHQSRFGSFQKVVGKDEMINLYEKRAKTLNSLKKSEQIILIFNDSNKIEVNISLKLPGFSFCLDAKRNKKSRLLEKN